VNSKLISYERHHMTHHPSERSPSSSRISPITSRYIVLTTQILTFGHGIRVPVCNNRLYPDS